MPRADRARASRRKCVDYLLDPGHPVGRHKARLFAAILGYGPDDGERLRQDLTAAAAHGTVTRREDDREGAVNWRVELTVTGPNGTTGTVVSWWRSAGYAKDPWLMTAWPRKTR
jgi:hypothetical protein